MATDRRTRVRRFLRIAVSGVCVIACVLLMLLWLRSYYREYALVWGLTDHRGFFLDSSNGQLLLNYLHEFGIRTPTANQPKVVLSKWWTGSFPPDEFVASWGFPREQFLFQWKSSSGNILVKSPHWVSVTLFAGLAALPWIRWRFSLRTLLIATTLVAVGLASLIYSAG